jgi:hypothetical protein
LTGSEAWLLIENGESRLWAKVLLPVKAVRELMPRAVRVRSAEKLAKATYLMLLTLQANVRSAPAKAPAFATVERDGKRFVVAVQFGDPKSNFGGVRQD